MPAIHLHPPQVSLSPNAGHLSFSVGLRYPVMFVLFQHLSLLSTVLVGILLDAIISSLSTQGAGCSGYRPPRSNRGPLWHICKYVMYINTCKHKYMYSNHTHIFLASGSLRVWTAIGACCRMRASGLCPFLCSEFLVCCA